MGEETASISIFVGKQVYIMRTGAALLFQGTRLGPEILSFLGNESAAPRSGAITALLPYNRIRTYRDSQFFGHVTAARGQDTLVCPTGAFSVTCSGTE